MAMKNVFTRLHDAAKLVYINRPGAKKVRVATGNTGTMVLCLY